MAGKRKDALTPFNKGDIVAWGTVICVLGFFIFLFFSPGIFAPSIDARELTIAGFGAIGVICTAVFGYLSVARQTNARHQAECEMRFQTAALDFSRFLTEWGGTMEDLEKLMAETEIDRFMVLRAWNGYYEPRWTTAVLQIRRGPQQLISYVHFELDDDYISRLREIMQTTKLRFRTAELPATAVLRAVYETEGVKSAAWFHLQTQELVDTSSRAIMYCSFATHSSSDITDATYTRCAILAARLKGVASEFD